MRLTKIRLGGFKSFVDETVLKLPSSLVGIVGPNGCGKSNVIDAVRWVMGESSARHLRGDSMDDVIFSGSSARKPVGRAFVELVFDNSDGSLGGEYAAYAEISIRREVERDGQSKYLLNNVRCRRRDIRDIFLGTGLGPRSYAIIEQGMISRLIEARPEEMRVYLEEAAGISKYRERRRETENRIGHARDNLARLDDLREELDKQLERLERQARAAERYATLREEERRVRGELLVLRRRELETRRDAQAREIGARETALEGVVAELRASETALEHARGQRVGAAETVETTQQHWYRAGLEVTRLEQSIEHTRESRRQRSRELEELESALAEARAHLADDGARIEEIERAMASDEPAFAALADTQRLSAEALVRAESELAGWRERQDAFAARHAETMQTAQVERSRVEQLERAIAGALERRERLEAERVGLDPAPLEARIAELAEEEGAAAAEETRLGAVLADSARARVHLREAGAALEEELDVARARLQGAIGRRASLEALQQAAFAADAGDADGWAARQGLDARPRLGQRLRAEPGWERAVELVLGAQLDAVVVDDETLLERCLAELPETRLGLVRGDVEVDLPPSTTAWPTLASKVSGAAALADRLVGVHAVATREEALACRDVLGAGESVVTPDGLWLGRGWLRLARAELEDGVLARAAELEALGNEILALEGRVAELVAEREESARREHEHESRRETLQHAANDALRALAGVRAALAAERERREQIVSRTTRLAEELTEIDAALARDRAERDAAETRRADALGALDGLEGEQARLHEEKGVLHANVAAARERAESDRASGQELAIRVESMRSVRAATAGNIERLGQRIERLAAREAELLAALASDGEEDPLGALESALQGALERRAEAERALGNARSALGEVESRLAEHERARRRHEGRANELREALAEAKLASQEAVVRLATLDEQLAEQEHDVQTLLANLDPEATIDARAAELESLERRIARLGPINLAAIDERAEQLERKTYLDEQHADVSEALATLERAIQKIDRETRQRFRETYERVDAKFKHFFPRLFGGGSAALEMNGDDLLTTGIGVAAQPPGKRVTNIHLLSGGEKALTAVALVFAFFELNPSPFCMLDEVDAPLDDANVGRFRELVGEMSERVQFIFITHNKVTMELADQLMGVTMNEPGVSRLVAVDVHEAVELAGARAPAEAIDPR